MTVKEYNEWHSKLNHAKSFVNCLDHALQKSDDNAKMQLRVIGWSEELKSFLNNAIECYDEKMRSEINISGSPTSDSIIRCKDCLFCVGLFSFNKDEETIWRCQRTGLNLLYNEGYCSWARRQNDV